MFVFVSQGITVKLDEMNDLVIARILSDSVIDRQGNTDAVILDVEGLSGESVRSHSHVPGSDPCLSYVLCGDSENWFWNTMIVD